MARDVWALLTSYAGHPDLHQSCARNYRGGTYAEHVRRSVS